MKAIRYLIPLVLFVGIYGAFTSCKKGELGVVSFDASQQAYLTIPASTLLDLPNIVSPQVSTNWEGTFNNHDADRNKVRELKLKAFNMTITNPPGKTWKFMRSIEVYIRADGMEETKIAFADNISENVGQTLMMQPIDVDLAPYARANNFTLRVNTNMRELNSSEVDVTADLSFRVTANVLD